MTAEQKPNKVFELNALARKLFVHGLRQRFPDVSATEFHRILLERLAKCHNQSY